MGARELSSEMKEHKVEDLSRTPFFTILVICLLILNPLFPENVQCYHDKMVRFQKVSLFLAVSLLLTACNSTTPDDPDPTAEPVQIPTVSESPTPTPSPTTTTPAPEVTFETPNASPSPTKASTPTSKKTIALTFDDGPSEYTDDILKILDEEDAPATFFVLGASINEQNKPTLAAMQEDGHQVAIHTWSHTNLKHLNDEEVLSELDRTADVLEEVTGERPTCYRPPYGETSTRVQDVTSAHGYDEVKWNIDSQDWQRPGVDAIVQNSEISPYDGEPAIMLMHDGGGNREQTIEALPRVIQHYKDEGYEFVPAC